MAVSVDQAKVLAMAAARKRATGAGSAPSLPAAPPQSMADQLSAGFTSGVNAIPIAGPTILSGLENLKGMVQDRSPQDVAASDKAQVEQNPVASTVGTIAGTALPFLAGGEIPVVAKVLGMDSTVPLLARSLASMGSSAVISGADTLARGGDPGQAIQDAGIGGAIGAVIPGAGEVLGKVTGMLGNKTAQTVDALTNTDRAAGRVTKGAIEQDLKAGKAMSSADEANAVLNGQPVINADRFGANVRKLARTAANADGSAQQALNDTVQERFITQAPRTVDFVKRITGGNVDDLALHEQISTAARVSNRGNYNKAYAAPVTPNMRVNPTDAQTVWTSNIANLFQSPDFRAAVQGASKTAANDAAAHGFKAVKSPFVFDAAGTPSFAKAADGSVAKPTLQFWDIVQRNLRGASEKSYAGGDKLLGGQLKEMRTQLLSQLDTAVPAFAKARQGAAAAFGAEDAIDAGKKFVSQRMAIPEARKAYTQFTPAERKAFATGFASELIDKIGSVSDRVNVINQMFGSPAARAQVELALGKNAAMELEHFVRIEDIMQMTKQAVQGNSTTAQQLIASGLIGGGLGGLTSGWDPGHMASGALLFTAGRAGIRALGKTVDQKVMQRVAEMLSSNDPAVLAQATKSATWSPAFRDAVQAIEHGLAALTRGTGEAAVRQPPAMITVNGGNVSTSAPGP